MTPFRCDSGFPSCPGGGRPVRCTGGNKFSCFHCDYSVCTACVDTIDTIIQQASNQDYRLCISMENEEEKTQTKVS